MTERRSILNDPIGTIDVTNGAAPAMQAVPMTT